jgi:AsmA protein
MQVDSLEVEGLKAQLVRFKDGSTNVDDLWRDLAALEAARIDLDSVRVLNSQLSWHDELLWQRGALHELTIDVGRLADGVPAPLVAAARIDAPVANVDARLNLKGRLMFDAGAGRAELARIEGRLEGKALGIDNVVLSTKGDLIASPRERTLQVENLVLSSMHKSGLAVHSTVVSAPELRFGEYRLSGAAVQVDASVAHPDRNTTLAVKVPRFEWADRALRETTVQAQLSVKAGGAQLRVQGASPLALALDDPARIELGAMELTAQASHPALAAAVPAQLKGRLEIDFKQQRMQGAWSGQLAGHALELDVGVAEFGARPRWTVNADLARLDAEPWLSAAWRARAGDDAAPFDPSVLRDTQALGRIRVDELKLGALTLRKAVARFEIDKSMLALEPVVAQLHGADVDASFTIDAAAATPSLGLKGSVSNLDLRGLLADVARTPWLEGRGALTWDVSASGASIGSLRQALAGSVDVHVKGGALSGIDLPAALLAGKADLGKKGSAAPREFDTQAATPFSDLKLSARFKEGRAHAQALEMQASAVRSEGAGEIVLDTGTLDLRLQATVAPKAPAELAALAGVSVPLHVTGPWRTPRFVLDPGAATGDKVPRAIDPAQARDDRAVSHEPAPLALSAR